MKTRKRGPKAKKVTQSRTRRAAGPRTRPGSLLAELAAGKLKVLRDKTSHLDEVAGGPTPL